MSAHTIHATLTLNGQTYLVLTAEVGRTYRQTVKVGDGFRTIEQTTAFTVGIPADACPIASAMEIGQAIETAHIEALAPELERAHALARAASDNTPATAKQSNYLRSLLRDLDSTEQAAAYTIAGVDSRIALTAGSASVLIDTIRSRREEITVQAAHTRIAALPPVEAAEDGELPF